MHLRAYAHYNGTAHLAVFVLATEGDFDDIIKWPFPFAFTLQIVDQQPDGKNFSNKFVPPYGGALSRRYCTAVGDIPGYGTKNIASHETLETRCYIKDDGIVIKLIVHYPRIVPSTEYRTVANNF